MSEAAALNLEPQAQPEIAEMAELSGAEARRFLLGIFAVMFYCGYTMATGGLGAPYIAQSFHLTQSGIAGVFAWISISAFGALALSRLGDRVGRRRVLQICMVGIPLSAFAAAVSPSVVPFIVAEISKWVFLSATTASALVMVAEELPVAERSAGQSRAGIGLLLGSGACVLLMPLFVRSGFSWRLAMGVAGACVLAYPLISSLLPESRRWQIANAAGTTAKQSLFSVFGAAYRRRAIPILICTVFSFIANTAVQTWSYFHMVSVVGLSAGAASGVMLVGGGLSMVGFKLGSWSSERFGRVPTVVASGLLVSVGAMAFYWGPPKSFVPVLWLGMFNAWYMAATNLGTVGGNSAATELFPTSIRNTMMGWFTLATALASTTSHIIVATAAPLFGGLSPVVGYLALLTIPSAIIFGFFVNETRGLTLEVASGEVAAA